MRERIGVIFQVAVLGLVISTSTPAIVSSSSNRASVLAFPLEKASKVTSCYGPRRLLEKFHDFHHGVDFHARPRTPVFAVANGFVVWEGPSGCAGRALVIEHNLHNGETLFSFYRHLKGYSVKIGDIVTRGQQIAMSGASGVPLTAEQEPEHRGCVLGPHLHFELKKVAASSANRVADFIVKTHGHLSRQLRPTDPSQYWPELKSVCQKHHNIHSI